MEEDRKKRDLLEAMDEMNERYGDTTLTWARVQGMDQRARGAGEVISPAWRTRGVRSVQLK